MNDGEIFNVITHGVRNMPGYAYQIPAQDRWAIITYIRALQLSQQNNAAASASPVPQTSPAASPTPATGGHQ